ncbi:hypothetical protein CDEST_14819 [Colletotrichum destructivum]|uniref:Uncharacterized protein n=1 Tax=Colletotrichum destructivum TaxID=34406 RepID=A0AAX4J305_9PEZI|nr:hypothetical protein CDEST_14819 [Colletotrichum destructivum]
MPLVSGQRRPPACGGIFLALDCVESTAACLSLGSIVRYRRRQTCKGSEFALSTSRSSNLLHPPSHNITTNPTSRTIRFDPRGTCASHHRIPRLLARDGTVVTTRGRVSATAWPIGNRNKPSSSQPKYQHENRSAPLSSMSQEDSAFIKHVQKSARTPPSLCLST